jgi:hypothetical protein
MRPTTLIARVTCWPVAPDLVKKCTLILAGADLELTPLPQFDVLRWLPRTWFPSPLAAASA